MAGQLSADLRERHVLVGVHREEGVEEPSRGACNVDTEALDLRQGGRSKLAAQTAVSHGQRHQEPSSMRDPFRGGARVEPGGEYLASPARQQAIFEGNPEDELPLRGLHHPVCPGDLYQRQEQDSAIRVAVQAQPFQLCDELFLAHGVAPVMEEGLGCSASKIATMMDLTPSGGSAGGGIRHFGKNSGTVGARRE